MKVLQLHDEVTAEVNSGLTKYLFKSGQLDKFKAHFSHKYGIKVDVVKEEIVFRGSFRNIIDAENHLDTIVETGSLFNDNLKPESYSVPSGFVNAMDKSPIYTSNIGGASNNLTSSFTSFADSFNTPKNVDVQKFDLDGKSVRIFKTDDFFSFSTDVKVLTKDNEHTHKHENPFMRQAKDKIPKLEGMQVKKLCVIPLGQPRTCKFVAITPVLNNNITIAKRENEKNKFKSDVLRLTKDILQKADEVHVQRITLPLLVNAESTDAHISVCCNAMAEGILSFLEGKTNINHIYVVLESESIVKRFSDNVKKNMKK